MEVTLIRNILLSDQFRVLDRAGDEFWALFSNQPVIRNRASMYDGFLRIVGFGFGFILLLYSNDSLRLVGKKDCGLQRLSKLRDV